MKRIQRLFLALTLLTFSSSSAVVILLHGTFGLNTQWWNPGGDFYEELEHQAQKMGHNVVPFSWTGDLGDAPKVKAARILAKLIMSYPATEKIILIGHSHGGNVIHLASQLVHYATNQPAGPTIQEPSSILFTRKPTAQDFASFAFQFCLASQDPDMKALIKELMQAHQELSHYDSLQSTTRFFWNKPKKQKIDTVYLLATPVNSDYYKPNMEVIGKIYNLYSHGDSIQGVFGLYSQRYSNIANITNFRITFEQDSDALTYDPGHCQLHDTLVAKWLLAIPCGLKSAKNGTFDSFDEYTDGIIHFKKGAPPRYNPEQQAI